MVPRRSPFSENDLILCQKNIEETLLELFYSIKDTSLNILSNLKNAMKSKLEMGGKYTLVFSCGSNEPYLPFLSIYTTDDLKSSVILTTSNPLLDGEILVNPDELKNSAEIMNILKTVEILEKSWKKILQIYDKKYVKNDVISRFTVLSRYRIPPSLIYIGDERFLKERILSEKLEDHTGVTMLTNLSENDVDIIMKDVGKVLWDTVIPTFSYDKMTITFKYPPDLRKKTGVNKALVFEISRHLRNKLSNSFEIEEATVPKGIEGIEPLVSFAMNLFHYPKFKENLKDLSSKFLRKLRIIIEFIEDEAKEWDL